MSNLAEFLLRHGGCDTNDIYLLAIKGKVMEKLIEDMKKHTDLWPWYWRSVGEKCYAFDVVEAYPLHELAPIPEPGSQLVLDEDEHGDLIWVGENGTHMIIENYIAEIEQQNGDTICSFIAAAHAHLIGKELLTRR